MGGLGILLAQAPWASPQTDSLVRSPAPHELQCEDQVEGQGKNETHVSIFNVLPGTRELRINLDFYQIPDSFKVNFKLGTLAEGNNLSGRRVERIPLPLEIAQHPQVTLTITGNDDPETKWNYKVFCNEQIPPEPNSKPIVRNYDTRIYVPSSSYSSQDFWYGRRPAIDFVMNIVSSSRNWAGLEDLYVVEHLTIVDENLNELTDAPSPFENQRTPEYHGTWGLPNVQCPTLYSKSKTIDPGGMKPKGNKYELADRHGSYALTDKTEVPVSFYVLQTYKWFKAGRPEEVFDLKDQDDRLIKKIIHRIQDGNNQHIKVFYVYGRQERRLLMETTVVTP